MPHSQKEHPLSQPSLDTFKCRRTLDVGSKTYTYFSLPEAEKNGLPGISRLPFSLKVLLEICSASRTSVASPPTTSAPPPAGWKSAGPTARSTIARRAF